jgi:hypothetical protein
MWAVPVGREHRPTRPHSAPQHPPERTSNPCPSRHLGQHDHGVRVRYGLNVLPEGSRRAKLVQHFEAQITQAARLQDLGVTGSGKRSIRWASCLSAHRRFIGARPTADDVVAHHGQQREDLHSGLHGVSSAALMPKVKGPAAVDSVPWLCSTVNRCR